jgi:hypothetical protein
MGYSKLYLIWGVRINATDLGNFINTIRERHKKSVIEFSDPPTRSELSVVIDEFNELIDRYCDLKVYPPLCCSKSKKYIVGHKLNTYRFMRVSCDDCNTMVFPYNGSETKRVLTYCNRCFNSTNNGSYDIKKIFKHSLRVPSERICKWCFGDNKEVITNKCKFCDAKDFERIGATKSVLQFDLRIAELMACFDPGFYYMVNDCIYCS